MKSTFLVLAIVIVGVWAHDMPSDEKQKLKDIHNNCQSHTETHAEVDKIKNIAQHTEDTHVRAHMHCIATHIGLQKHNGDIDQDVMKHKISMVTDDNTKIDEVVHKCSAKKGNAEETAMWMWICLIQNHINYGILNVV